MVTAFSVGMTAAALFGFSFSTSFWMLCLWAVPYGLGAGSVDVAALTPDRVERLRAVFWDMCTLSSSVETIEHAATDDTEAWTEKKLHITITPKSADDMRTAYAFSTDQSNTLSELLGELDVLGGLLANLGISDEKVIEVLQRLPDDLSPERRAVVETACKLVGKVNYFWGGKSSAIGWDSLGNADESDLAGERHQRHLPALWPGLFRFSGLGAEKCGPAQRWALVHRQKFDSAIHR